MDELKELLARLDGVEFEDKDGFISGVTSSFENLSNGAQARIAELEAANAQLAADLQKTQADNYKLMVANTAQAKEEEPEEKTEVTEEDKDVTKLIKED